MFSTVSSSSLADEISESYFPSSYALSFLLRGTDPLYFSLTTWDQKLPPDVAARQRKNVALQVFDVRSRIYLTISLFTKG